MPFVTSFVMSCEVLFVGLLLAQATVEPPSTKADVDPQNANAQSTPKTKTPTDSSLDGSLDNDAKPNTHVHNDTLAVKESVAKLLVELASSSAEKRRDAEKQIVALGASALPHLPAINAKTAEQTRIRLQRIRQAISNEEAEGGYQPKRYSLVGQLTVQSAFKSLQKQAGVPTTLLEDYEAELSAEKQKYDIKRRPFWETMETVLGGANVMLDPYSGDSRLFALVPDQREQVPAAGLVSTDGPFRFELSRMEAVQDIRNPRDRILRLIVMVFWEPGVVPVTLRHDFNKMNVTPGDEVLKLLRDQTPRQITVQESLASVDLQFPFELPSRDLKRIETLSGVITATIPAKKHKFEFTNLGGDEPLQQSNGGVDVTIERARTVQNLQDVRVLVRVPNSNDQTRGQINWVYNNIAYLAGADGKRHEDVLTEIYQQSDGEVGLLYKYDAPGDIADYTFHYETPAGFRTLSAKYSFSDIELP